jgi:hypothetical protein
MTHRIIPRAEWGARHDRGVRPAPLPAVGTWAHHSVTIAPDLLPPFDDDFAAIRTLEQIGEDRFGRGISYTWAITPAGLIFEGHGEDREGAHTRGYNRTHRAIVFVGNFEHDRPTPAALEAAAWLLADRFLAGVLLPASIQGGHRDTGAATACPGRHVMAALPSINRRAAELVQAVVGAPIPAQPTPEEVSDVVPAWAAAAWSWATGRGLIKDDRPNDPVTRAELVVVLHRLAEGETETVPGYAGPAYEALGDLINRPRPSGLLTEARFVTLLHRLGVRRPSA